MLFFLSKTAFPAEDLNGRKITSIGCHSWDGTCYISLDGQAFGNSLTCSNKPTDEIRFDNTDTNINMKRAYQSLLIAYLTDKKVSITIDGCSRQGWPTLIWYRIHG